MRRALRLPPDPEPQAFITLGVPRHQPPVPPGALTIVANTGDDLEWHGLRVCPDVDIVIYTLAGRVDRDRGWGLAGDTTRVVDAIASLGEDAWFRLGDLDLARRLCAPFGVRCDVLPATDEDVRTRVVTADGELAFQDYFVRRGHRDEVLALRFAAAESATLLPAVADELARAERIVFAPSNPFLSIGPMLAVPGLRDAIRRSSAHKVPVSPIVARRALKGPAAAMMASLGYRADAVGVAAIYRDLIDNVVVDRQDAALVDEVENLAMMCEGADTVMTDAATKAALARWIQTRGAREG